MAYKQANSYANPAYSWRGQSVYATLAYKQANSYANLAYLVRRQALYATLAYKQANSYANLAYLERRQALYATLAYKQANSYANLAYPSLVRSLFELFKSGKNPSHQNAAQFEPYILSFIVIHQERRRSARRSFKIKVQSAVPSVLRHASTSNRQCFGVSGHSSFEQPTFRVRELLSSAELGVAAEGTELLLDLETFDDVTSCLGGTENLHLFQGAERTGSMTLTQATAQNSQKSAIVEVDEQAREEGDGHLASAKPGRFVDDKPIHGADGGAVHIIGTADSEKKDVLDRTVIHGKNNVLTGFALELGSIDGVFDGTIGKTIQSPGPFAEAGVTHVGHHKEIGFGHREIFEMAAECASHLERDRQTMGGNKNSGFAFLTCHFYLLVEL